MDSINRQRQKRKKLQERDGQSQNQPSQASNVDGSGMLVNQLNSIRDGIDFDQSLQLNGVHQGNVHHAWKSMLFSYRFQINLQDFG